jgi:putative holliday junction resolvase
MIANAGLRLHPLFGGGIFVKRNYVLAIIEIDRLKEALNPGQRLLGLDVGAKTIGLALSDARLIVASPVDTLRRGRFADDAKRLARMIAAEDVGALVIGLPVEMSGREGPRCQSLRQFADNLLKVVDLPVAFWDERLSTAAVERVLIDEADMSRKRRAEVVDKMAAAYILQGALDAM